uniref:Transketolase N-terminal domain-containing protein n=1 Tax=Sciurus vulgaris TaxID=55149 RepID=A0A8D2CMN0_SCIVU
KTCFKDKAEFGYHKPDQQKLQALKDTANRLRISSIQATMAAGSCHPTPCCSAPEIMAVLFFHTMRYKAQDPRNPHNDHFVLSKAFTDMATGSLGQGLSAACGMAHTAWSHCHLPGCCPCTKKWEAS